MIVLEIGVDLKDVRAGINPERKKGKNRSMMEKYHTREKEISCKISSPQFYPLVQFLIIVCDFRGIEYDW
jgi:hypothetical protein